MTVYIALLRGINVSGQKIIKMEHLRAVFKEMQFKQVRTYIQSGNVVFETEEQDTSLLEKKIEQKIEQVYSFQVPVMVRTSRELELIVEQNPIDITELSANEKIYVSFLSQEPNIEAVQLLKTFESDIDDFHVHGREVYILIRAGYGESLFSNNFLEKKLTVSATTRNWATVNKLIAMAALPAPSTKKDRNTGS
ncbi:DUF1697 domain-containing protein [Paenibacillus prosopidis]|uniref:Uncharacterized protein (DUF1697 family) n=1 Tax=Paenibacillus prosopidis TaxID=630520 RepID=A0A368W3W6_9BACL|nr:DUF1697 domain-containing protein [Paenibacillus prosopidis]RCW48841.1 uncharacterized protein (DUF1697 family) [Paenibacillus prosopidis]